MNIIFQFLLYFAIAILATKKGRSGINWFGASALISALGNLYLYLTGGPPQSVLEWEILRTVSMAAFLWYLPTKNNSPAETQEPKIKQCPFCAEDIKLEANLCKHCHKELDTL